MARTQPKDFESAAKGINEPFDLALIVVSMGQEIKEYLDASAHARYRYLVYAVDPDDKADHLDELKQRAENLGIPLIVLDADLTNTAAEDHESKSLKAYLRCELVEEMCTFE